MVTVIATGAEVVVAGGIPGHRRHVVAAVGCRVEFHDTEYGAVVSSPPTLVPSTLNCTPATPTLWAALAATFTDPDTVAPAAGAVTDTVGAPCGCRRRRRLGRRRTGVAGRVFGNTL